jgi:hypothetical protein
MTGRLGKTLFYSLLGALGASVSGVFVNWGLIPLMQAGTLGLYLALVQGLVFLPLGTSLGLSAMLCIGAPGPLRKVIMVHAGIGGILYGVFSFFSIGGAVLGLILFGVNMSVGIGRAFNSLRLAVLQGLVFLLSVAILVLLLRSGDWAFVPVMSAFDPLRTMNAAGLQSMGWLVIVGYILNLGVLVALWEKIR